MGEEETEKKEMKKWGREEGDEEMGKRRRRMETCNMVGTLD